MCSQRSARTGGRGAMSGTGIEKVAALLAERVADKVVGALMKAGFDKEFANTLLRVFKEQIEERA